MIHNPEMLGPHTEIYGLITPGDWVDFFRYVSEPYEGILVPETDDRDLKSLLIPKVMAAKGKFDVVSTPYTSSVSVAHVSSSEPVAVREVPLYSIFVDPLVRYIRISEQTKSADIYLALKTESRGNP